MFYPVAFDSQYYQLSPEMHQMEPMISCGYHNSRWKNPISEAVFPRFFPPWTCTAFPHSFPIDVSETQMTQNETVQMVSS